MMKNSVRPGAGAKALVRLFRIVMQERRISINALLELPRSLLRDYEMSRALAFILTCLLMKRADEAGYTRPAKPLKVYRTTAAAASGVIYSPALGVCAVRLIDFFFAYKDGSLDLGYAGLQKIFGGVQTDTDPCHVVIHQALNYIRQNWRRIPDASSKEENLAIIKIARLRGFFRGAGFEEFIFALQQNNSASDPIDLSVFI